MKIENITENEAYLNFNKEEINTLREAARILSELHGAMYNADIEEFDFENGWVFNGVDIADFIDIAKNINSGKINFEVDNW